MSRRAISCSASPEEIGACTAIGLAVGDRPAGLVHRHPAEHGPADVAVGQEADQLAVAPCTAPARRSRPLSMRARASVMDASGEIDDLVEELVRSDPQSSDRPPSPPVAASAAFQ